jgi:ribosomal-protein-alanine N-acetyltransferase
MTRALARGDHAWIRHPGRDDSVAFVAAARRSRGLHGPWVQAPDTPEAFEAYVRRSRRSDQAGFLISRTADDAIAGVANVSAIVRGAFQSGFLGYYAFTPLARKGYLREGLELVVRYAFEHLDLHRLEANVRPENIASVRLIRSLGFEPRARSPRYLFLDGDWRDHVGYVRLREPGPPVFGAHGAVTLHDVTAEDRRALLELRVAPDQRNNVGEVARYLVRCLLEMHWQPVAIRADGELVGFVMWARDADDGSYWIGGFQIDQRFQRRGYGRAALTALIEALRAKPECREIVLTYLPANTVAGNLYASLGFRETGEIVEDEAVARLAVGRPQGAGPRPEARPRER